MSINNKCSETFLIINELGLHARAAAALVKIANRFKSEIEITRDSITVNGKSIMGVLMLAAAKGTEIKVDAMGSDAIDAIREIGHLIKDRFGEEN